MQISTVVHPLSGDIQRLPIWIRRALALWVILAVAASVKVLVQPHRHALYPIFSTGARHWWTGLPMYASYEGLDLFRYSPTFAVAVTPFALLPDRVGGVLWILASVAAFAAALRVLVREVFPGSWPPWREAAFLTLAMFGSARGIWAGHNNAFLFAAVAFGLAAVARKRWWSAAFLLAIPVFIKVWPIAIAMLLMACWPRQLIGRFLAASLGLAAVPLLTRPPAYVFDAYRQWWEMLVSTGGLRWQGFRDGWTICETLHLPVTREMFFALQLAAAAGVLAWCLWQRRRIASTRHFLTSMLSIWIAWQLLFGLGSERLTYQIIAPLATWALLESLGDKRWRGLAAAAWLMTGPLGVGGVERALLPYLAAAPIILPAGALALVAWTLADTWRQPTAIVLVFDADTSGTTTDQAA